MGYFMNPGGAWSKDFLAFELEAACDNKDCRRFRARRCGEVSQKHGLPSFPMLSMGAPGDVVPAELAALIPEVLTPDAQPAAGHAPPEAEAGSTPKTEAPPAVAEPPCNGRD